MPSHYDVIIIGAGVSGLTIASNLLAKDPNLDLVILEANGHVGGRCWAKNGIDMGASWIHSCEGLKKYKALADITMCKQTCCDTYIDPEVDAILGIPSTTLHEYARIYKVFVQSSSPKTYKALAAHLKQHPNASHLMAIMKYHRAKLGFQEPQGTRLDTNAYTQDAMPIHTMYATFVEPLLTKVGTYIRMRTPVRSINRAAATGGLFIHTAQGVYTCDKLVYTGTFPALQNITVPHDIISKRLRKHIHNVQCIKVLKIIWSVDAASNSTLAAIFGKARQLHVPSLPWTVMLHEKKGYLYTYAAGPAYERISNLSIRHLRAELQKALNIRIKDYELYDFNKNKYYQTSYASIIPTDTTVQAQLANPSENFYMCGDAIVTPKDFKLWEGCTGTVTGAIHTAHYVSKLMSE